MATAATSTFGGLEIAKKALFTARYQMDITNHNVSNADTDGFTRQRVITSAISAVNGYGVQADYVGQIRDQFLDLQYREQASYATTYETLADEFSWITSLFSPELGSTEVDTATMLGVLKDIYTGLDTYVSDPSNLAVRTNLQQLSNTLTEVANYYYEKMEDQYDDMNYSLEIQVNRVNAILDQITELNKQIYEYELDGSSANELRDTRNTLLDELATYTDISYKDFGGNNFSIWLGDRTEINKDNIAATENLLVYGAQFTNHLVMYKTGDREIPNPNDPQAFSNYEIYLESEMTLYNNYLKYTQGDDTTAGKPYYDTMEQKYKDLSAAYTALMGDGDDNRDSTYEKAVIARDRYCDALENYTTAINKYNTVMADPKSTATQRAQALTDKNNARDIADNTCEVYKSALDIYNFELSSYISKLNAYNDEMRQYDPSGEYPDMGGYATSKQIETPPAAVKDIIVPTAGKLANAPRTTEAVPESYQKEYNDLVDDYNTILEANTKSTDPAVKKISDAYAAAVTAFDTYKTAVTVYQWKLAAYNEEKSNKTKENEMELAKTAATAAKVEYEKTLTDYYEIDGIKEYAKALQNYNNHYPNYDFAEMDLFVDGVTIMPGGGEYIQVEDITTEVSKLSAPPVFTLPSEPGAIDTPSAAMVYQRYEEFFVDDGSGQSGYKTMKALYEEITNTANTVVLGNINGKRDTANAAGTAYANALEAYNTAAAALKADPTNTTKANDKAAAKTAMDTAYNNYKTALTDYNNSLATNQAYVDKLNEYSEKMAYYDPSGSYKQIEKLDPLDETKVPKAPDYATDYKPKDVVYPSEIEILGGKYEPASPQSRKDVIETYWTNSVVDFDDGSLASLLVIRDGNTSDDLGILYVVEAMNDFARKMTLEMNLDHMTGYTLPYEDNGVTISRQGQFYFAMQKREVDADGNTTGFTQINSIYDMIDNGMLPTVTGNQVYTTENGGHLVDIDNPVYTDTVTGKEVVVDLFADTTLVAAGGGKFKDAVTDVMNNDLIKWTSVDNFALSANIVKDVSYMAASSEKVYEDPDTNTMSGNAEIASKLAALTTKTDEYGVADNFASALESLISDISVRGNTLNKLDEAQQTRLSYINKQRLSIMSVSTDEEFTNVIKFSQAYNAAARLITTMDEMIDVVINKMGLVGRA